MRTTTFALSSLLLIANIALLQACADQVESPLDEAEQDNLSAGEKAAWVVWLGDLPPGGVDQNRSWNSTSPTGGGYGVSHVGLGYYTVSLLNFTSATGNAQVSAVGINNVRCKISNQFVSGSSVGIDVRCHNGAGAPADSNFVVSYATFVGGTTPANLGAYVWMNSTNGTTVARVWGDTITVSSGSTGVYTLTFATQPLSTGNLQVTAYGTDERYCKITSWTSSSVTVSCYAHGGVPSASKFNLRYTRAQLTCPAAIHDSRLGSGGYVFVSGTSVPTQYQFNWIGTSDPDCSCWLTGTNTVDRKGTGNVGVIYPGLGPGPIRQAPIVTAKGSLGAYCKLSLLAETLSPPSARMWVNCWNDTGTNLVDSDFTQILFSDTENICFN